MSNKAAMRDQQPPVLDSSGTPYLNYRVFASNPKNGEHLKDITNNADREDGDYRLSGGRIVLGNVDAEHGQRMQLS